MKTGKVFWGTFLIVFGFLLLIHTLGANLPDLGYIARFWPLLIVFWGLSLLKLNIWFNRILAVAGALFLSLICTSAIVNHSCMWQINDDSGCGRHKYGYAAPVNGKFVAYSHKFDSSVSIATVNIDGGASTYRIGDSTSNLLDIITDRPEHSFEFDEKMEANGNYTLDITGKNIHNFFHSDKYSRSAFIKLSQTPLWNLNFDIGASDLRGDISKYTFKEINVNAGAANVDLKLGNITDSSFVNIDCGASSVILRIPASIGCRINSETGLSSNNFSGFQKNEDDYFTENFNNSPKKLIINIDGGVSSFKVERY